MRRSAGLSLPIPYMAEGTREGDRGLLAALMLVHAGLFMAMPEALKAQLAFWPDHPRWYAALTSLVVHLNGPHLVVAMWPFWLFGAVVSGAVGAWFLPLYVGAGLAGSAAAWLAAAGTGAPLAGAHGAVAGLVGAALVLDPAGRLYCLTSVRERTFAGGLSSTRTSSVSFSVSVFVFGLLYAPAMAVLAAAFMPAALPSVVGGFVFGLLAGVALKKPPPGTPAAAQTLSGGPGLDPARALASASGAAAVEEAIKAGAEGEALQGFIDGLRRDPGFELSPNAQLWAADRLARAGRAHLARAALERFLRRHADDEHGAHAYLLSGFVHQTCFGDLETAVDAYRRAAAHPKAPAALRSDADKRLAAADALLKRTFVTTPKEGETYAVLMEGVAAPTEAHARLIAAAAGDSLENVAGRLAKAPGFLLRWMGMGEAGELAAALEAAGLPVVVLAESALPKLAAPVACGVPEGAFNGVRIREAGGLEVTLGWTECLLIAAGGVGMPRSRETQKGLFDVADIVVTGSRRGGGWGSALLGGRDDSIYVDRGGPRREYEAAVVHAPLIELAAADGRRWRWTPSPELDVDAASVQAFFDALQALVTAAPSIPVERGALAAFDRRIPEACLHPDLEAWDRYLLWQAALATAKRTRGA